MPTKQKHKCQSCGSVGIETRLAPFRGKLLCGGCMVRWIDLDKRLGRESSFEEMIASKGFWGSNKVLLRKTTGSTYLLRLPYSMWVRSPANDN